ncbi:DUF6944 family repetitive protein [Guptibacillus hwajinpoensis]|uniref:Uncharacterized protein n=1 Tax=Guptibacillus hwajinpoensis TaxID=208199 RepID=A0ABU0K635_9BACL|nr:hypothetical protein [Alkalihalobacillus hemicentroti]MDQ0484818.1 hypothetical protein [Alkalihalobacillus hemicentroti]
MNNEVKAVFGSWVQAIGTILSAIGSTPIKELSTDLLDSLNLIGNVMQGTGNALIADTIETETLDKLGNQIQAIGNSTVVTGILIDFTNEVKQILNIDGNWLQALGGGVSLADALGGERSTSALYSIYGNLLQAVGNSLQSISGIKELQGKEGQELNVVGSWIQAVGSVISAIGQTKYP